MIWQTRKDFRKDFFESYRRSKLQRANVIVPFGRTILKASPWRHKAKLPRKVSETFLIVDELLADALLWHHSFAMLLMSKNPKSENYLVRSLLALHMKVTQDAMVVRNLIFAGFDVQAKNLLRSIDEHTDAIYYLCLKPEVCAEFVKTKDEELANKFWFDHIRRSRKNINSEIEKIIKSGAIDKFSDFKSAERRTLSTTHHPSYVGSTIPFLVPYAGINITRYMFDLPSEYSYRTGRLLFYILAEVAICIGAINPTVKAIIERKRGNLLQKIVRDGRIHLGIMLLHLIENWRAPVFKQSKQMAEFLRQLPQEPY